MTPATVRGLLVYRHPQAVLEEVLMASILRPTALRRGDVVAVAALANGLDAEEVPLFERGFAVIESLGYRVQRSPLAEPGHAHWWSAARPEEVAHELNRLLRDPK